MKKSKHCYRLFKLFAVFLCSGLFFYLMIDVWKKYFGKMTSMGSSFEDQEVDLKYLPCLTFCSPSAYKTYTFSFENDTFLQNSYEKEEFFFNMTEINDKSSYHLEEIRGVYIGRCYMLCILKKVTEMETIYIKLQKKQDILGKNKNSIFLILFSTYKCIVLFPG